MKLFLSALLLASIPLQAADLKDAVGKRVATEYPSLLELYKHLHSNPELSFKEEKTAQRLAEELKKAGFEVTPRIGGHGVVGVLKNGSGPTIMIRCDMDALPVPEQTGVPYASKIKTIDAEGKEVSVMHACGHDVHMTSFIGAARVLSQLKSNWQGTLVLIAQPAEERGGGAGAMLKDGLFTKFPRPTQVIALHVASELPAGMVGYVEGFALANVDSVDITIKGMGGHGAWPQTTKDPIVLAAQAVMAFQTIVSRETAPGEPAVVTVGSIHGGAKHNIIPDEVKLQLTLRSYTDETRNRTIESIKRIVRGLALAAGLPEDKMPEVKIGDEFTPATYNDPELTKRLARVFGQWFGEGNVVQSKPVMGGEDFGRYGRTEHKIPICIFWLGAITAESVKQAQIAGKTLPSLHSPLFAPTPEPTLKTGVTSLTAAALELLGKK